MALNTERRDGVLFVDAWESVDGSNARSFEEALRNATTGDEVGVVVDFGNLTYLSSAGLRVMLIASRTFKQQNAAFAVCGLSGPVRSVFRISGFDRIIAVHDSRDGALSAMSS